MTRRAPGFSLVELMIVVAIIAIMLAIAVPTFNNSVHASKERGAVQKLNADFQWARGAAAAADASLFSSLVNTALVGRPVVVLTVNGDCSWTTTINGVLDPSHSMAPTDLANAAPGIQCSGLGLPAPAAFAFDSRGFVTTTGTLTYGDSGTSSQQFTFQILHSGAMFRVYPETS